MTWEISSLPRTGTTHSATVIPAKAGIQTTSLGVFPMQHLQTISDHKSLHAGLFFSINSTFHARFHFLSCFSRVIAFSILPCNSKYTKLCTLYFVVNPSTKSFLCSQTRFTRSLVTPM